MTTKNKQFAENLKCIRGYRSQAAFARELGLNSAQAYQNYENKGRIPRDEDLLKRMAELGRCTVDELLYSDFATSDMKHSYNIDQIHRLTVNESRDRMYGEFPEWYEQYRPGTSPWLREMSREEMKKDIDDALADIWQMPSGPRLAHKCHYIMDYLYELSNRHEENKNKPGYVTKPEMSIEEERRRRDDKNH